MYVDLCGFLCVLVFAVQPFAVIKVLDCILVETKFLTSENYRMLCVIAKSNPLMQNNICLNLSIHTCNSFSLRKRNERKSFIKCVDEYIM